MKQLFFTLVFLFCVTITGLYAQVPFKFNYQTVVRDANGAIVTTGPIALKFSIYDAMTGGTKLYEEDHTGITPNSFGIVNVQMGAGTVSVGTSLSSLNWGIGMKWVETQLTVGANINLIPGRSQLVSVPFALKAESADIKHATTGQISPSISNTQTNVWINGGQQLTVPSNGTYLILCHAGAIWDQGDQTIHAWNYRIRKNNTQDIGSYGGVNAFDYVIGRAVFNGGASSTAPLIVSLNANDIVSVEYMAMAASGLPSTASWTIVDGRSLSLIKLAD